MSMLTGFAPANAVANSTATGSEVFELPDIVDPGEAQANGYVGRVEAEEKDLYTFVFANGDGTNTMRIYSHPVKYVAEDGSIRDISLDIEAKTGGGFVTADHEIITTFESKLTEGVSLEYNDIELTLVPALGLGTMPTAELSTDGKVVTYEMNDITSFVYELTYAGFKEDIVVEEYTGQTEYEFTLFTNGLTLCEEYGSYYLADAEGNVEATIGDIIVFTADERNNAMGSMTYETVRANQEYVLTIHLDAEYLADEDTAYPIRIDPTIEINYDNNGAGAIEDVTINELATFSGTSGSLYVGRHPAGSLSRVLMRFPNLVMPVPFSPMILSAQVELRDLMCQGDEDITIYCYSYSESSPTWSEGSTTTWSSVGTSYLNSMLDYHIVSYGQGNVGSHRYAFDITSLAKLWADGTRSPSKGIVFKASSSFENQAADELQYWYKTFASYNRAAYRPSLTIKYETKAVFTIRNTSNGTKYLTATGEFVGGATFSSSLDTLDGTQLWCIEYLPAYGGFNIVSMGMRYDGGKDPYVVYNFTDKTGLGRQVESAAYKIYIPIRYSSSAFYFKNKSYTNYLSATSDNDVLSLSTSMNSASRFYVTKINTERFNNFWSGGYNSGIYDGTVHVKIRLDNSILTHELYKTYDFSSALWWNGITDAVVIYGPNDTVPAGITPFYVTFATDTSIDSATYGVTVPNGMTYSSFLSVADEHALLASDWNSVTIYLNGRTGPSNPFMIYLDSSADRETQVNKVICHEMGHALKLAHPSQSDSSASIHTFSNDHGSYPNQMSVYALMNQGRFNCTTRVLTAAIPQDHDYINLISKWEYHLDCDH